jgi:hypothetical protein
MHPRECTAQSKAKIHRVVKAKSAAYKAAVAAGMGDLAKPSWPEADFRLMTAKFAN